MEDCLVLRALEILRRACSDLHKTYQDQRSDQELDQDTKESPSLKELLLALGSMDIFSPSLLSRLRHLSSNPNSTASEIRHVAKSLQTEIQSWIDREVLRRLVATLRTCDTSSSVALLQALRSRLDRGFDPALQNLLLEFAVFPAVAAGLSSSSSVRDGCADVVAAMVSFNKDVFVGHVIMGCPPVHRALTASASPGPLRALARLVTEIKSALVDELHADGQIPGLVGLVNGPGPVTEAVLDVIMRMAYYARKEAVEVMVGSGVVGRLVQLQLSGSGWMFERCVARMAVQVEVGEGMRRREKMAAKRSILAAVRAAPVSEADAAAIVVEVLWGSFH